MVKKTQKTELLESPAKLLFIFFLGWLGCGPLASMTELTPPKVSINLTPNKIVYVAAAFFTDPIGSIATIEINHPHTTQTGQTITDSSDVVIKSGAGHLYIINRGSATIQVIDTTTLQTLGNFSVESGSNPQDLVVANSKAYITRLDPHHAANNKKDIWVVDPVDGTLLASIDLTNITETGGDRLARATQMVLVEDLLYILVQDLSKNFKADHAGKVAIIDTTTDTLVDVDALTNGIQGITLSGRNPTTLQYSPGLNQILITETGYFDEHFQTNTSDSFGGIEIINLADNSTEGIQIDDADFGGYLSSLEMVSDTLGIVTVNASQIATFNPTTLQVIQKNIYNSPGGFIPELLVDGNGFIWIPERNPTASGIVIVDPETGALQAGPIKVGALPASMALVP